jgi:hypothetical protein
MTIRSLVVLSAAIEMATGVALIVIPGLIGRALLGQDLSGAGIAVARLAGLGLFSLGLACWAGEEDVTPRAARALFVYNMLAALYLGYLRIGGGFVSYLLWPACAFHAVMTILIAVQNQRGTRPKYFE